MTTRAGATFLGVFLAATSAPAADVRIGVLGAVNFADLAVGDLGPADELVDFDTLTRWGAGGVLEIGLIDGLSLVAQPMYLGKGAKEEQLGIELLFKLTYVEVPVLLKYGFDTGGAVRPFVLAGPSIGFRDQAEFTIRALGQEETEDVQDETKSTDFSLWFGAGLDILAGNAQVFLEGGYALGLTDIDDTIASFKTRGFQVKAGVTFGL